MRKLIMLLLILCALAGCGAGDSSAGVSGGAPPGLVQVAPTGLQTPRVITTKLDMYLDPTGVLSAIQAPTLPLLADVGSLDAGDQVVLRELRVPVDADELGLEPGFNFGVDVGVFAGEDSDPEATVALADTTATVNGVAQVGASAVLRPAHLPNAPPGQDGPPLLRFRVGFQVTRYEPTQSYQFAMGSGYASAQTLVGIATVPVGNEIGVNLCNAYPTSLPPGTKLGYNDVEVTVLKPQTWIDHQDKGYLILTEPSILINGSPAFRTAVTMLIR